ncbi:hypothetical protein Tco_0898138, partial [Tanacetum coccineum]
MSDSEDSTVTYTVVSSPFGGLSDIGSPGVDGAPAMLEDPYAYMVAAFQAPPSPDYVSSPEYPPLPEFVPEPVYPEFMPPKEDVLPAKEQPLPAAVSPNADSPGYVPESDPEEDPEDDDDEDLEDDDEDPEEDLADYPTDRDDDDEDEEEPSGDEVGDEEEDEDDEEEEEEHPALADSVPPPVARILAIPTPPSSPLSLWSSPLPHIPSPSLPVSPPPPASPTYLLGYRAAIIRLRAEAPSTSHSLPLPPPIILSRTRSDAPPSRTPPILLVPLLTSSPSLLLPSTDHGADRPEVCLPPRKRLCFAFRPRYEVRESSSAPATRPIGGFRADYDFIATLDREIRRDQEREVGYGITDTWDEMFEDMPGVPATDETELGLRMTNFVTTVSHDTYEIYVRRGEAQDERSLMSSRLNLLQRDRGTHAHTALLMEREARLSRETWGWSMDASDLARPEVMALRTQVVAHQSEIAALRAADHARQAQLVETLRLMSTLQTQKMAPKRTTRANPADTTATTSVTNAQLKAMIDQGVIDALATRNADRNTNYDDSHNSGTGVRRMKRVAKECTYLDFMKCQPLNFTEGVCYE